MVDLTGQHIFIGNTSGGVGGIGTVNVTAGGILTAAQIVPGTGGLGTGFVNVTGAGSTVHLTGGAAFNGLDIGSWGTGVVTVANGGLIACASVAACAFNTIGNAAGSTGTLAINGGSVTGLGQLAVGAGLPPARLRHARRQHLCDALDHQRWNAVIERGQLGGRSTAARPGA